MGLSSTGRTREAVGGGTTDEAAIFYTKIDTKLKNKHSEVFKTQNF
jgi:hypothetical protein